MLSVSNAFRELVMFWDEDEIARTMLFDDFDATLSGMAPMSHYARQERRGAYLQVDETLTVKGCALFTIRFDKQGYAESGWNLPLKHMVEVAGLGPDMGRGPIRLACRSQCPVSWHSPRMWDPVLREELNTFEQIRKAMPAACARLGLSPLRAAVTETDMPVLAPPPKELTYPLLEVVNDDVANLMREIQNLQLKVQTLTTDKEETISELSFVHQQQLDILQTQNQKLVEQHKALKAQHLAQSERLEALQAQVLGLSTAEESLKREREEHEAKLKDLQLALSRAGEAQQQVSVLLEAKEHEYQSRISRIETDYMLSLDRRLEEESSRHLLSVRSLHAEISERDETILELEQQMEAMRMEQAKDAEATADEFLRRLQGMGMNFVAFHPGVGNLSVPVDELVTYIQNPTAYVAAKCLVSEALYKAWLQHYENPRCMADIGDDKCCNARLIRIDSPGKFIPGQSDHCARHQGADTAILNVLKFR